MLLLFKRRWREVGEQPCLWATLKLEFVVGDREESVQMDQPGTMQDLLEVLIMRRLQALDQLSLSFMSDVSWQDCTNFLQLIPPSVRKLALKNLDFLESTTPPIQVLAAELVAKLVKFEEVDFGIHGFLRDRNIGHAMLRAVTAVDSSREDSKLKVLTMPGFEHQFSVDALAEARKIITVNLLGSRIMKESIDLILANFGN